MKINPQLIQKAKEMKRKGYANSKIANAHVLTVSKFSNLTEYHEMIGFANPEKREKLEKLINL